ncbi:uncharacterized protein PV09_02434 [Verruconis gallopava]|uniref:Rhodopsin domain-containing protein n=1 Tax=Verruconis gallopava TaxID=253628 RepID=A0A0D1XVA5_9PEZI|nr:uncharacterized protein PV09_02434 [Verruconis gallopava]KIW06741.1 hypothetical protein PV09_02434 [Verruconis gallopava]
MISLHQTLARRANEENLQPWTVRVVASMTALATTAVLLRFCSRYLKRAPLWWDDGMVLFSLLWNYCVVGFIFAMYYSGMGIHASQVPMNDIVMMAKWLLVAEILYAWNLCWTKIAVLLMYYRIFHFSFFKRMAYGVGGFVIIWGITITFLFIFICVPVQKIWYPQLPGHCVNQVGTWVANATSTILTDLIILLLPIRELWKLQLKKFEKVALTLTFSLGFFVVFASAYRFSVLFSYTSKDPTYTLAPTVGWTSIEMSAGIVSACLPVMRPIIQFVAKKLGLDGSMFLSNPLPGMSKSSKRHSSKRSGTGTDVELSRSLTKKDNASSWLEDQDSESLVPPANVKLRPDHGFEFRVTSSHTNGDFDLSDNYGKVDHRIMVTTDFSHTTNKI